MVPLGYLRKWFDFRRGLSDLSLLSRGGFDRKQCPIVGEVNAGCFYRVQRNEFYYHFESDGGLKYDYI